MMHEPIKNKKLGSSGERGVALLFVVLLTSVLLLVCIGIANVSYQEETFFIEAKDSARAFFAADTGIECGLMLDSAGFFGGTPTSAALCGSSVPVTISSGGGGSYAFAIPLGTQCAAVTVNKDYMYVPPGVLPPPAPASYTQIQSYGYNVPDTGGTSTCVSGTPGPKVITRALGVKYPNP